MSCAIKTVDPARRSRSLLPIGTRSRDLDNFRPAPLDSVPLSISVTLLEPQYFPQNRSTSPARIDQPVAGPVLQKVLTLYIPATTSAVNFAASFRIPQASALNLNEGAGSRSPVIALLKLLLLSSINTTPGVAKCWAPAVATRPGRPSSGNLSKCYGTTTSHSVEADWGWTAETPTAPTRIIPRWMGARSYIGYSISIDC